MHILDNGSSGSIVQIMTSHPSKDASTLNGKRKIGDEGSRSNKRTRNDDVSSRSMQGQRTMGGLIIFRQPSAPPLSSSNDRQQQYDRSQVTSVPPESGSNLKPKSGLTRSRSENARSTASTSSNFLTVPKGNELHKRLTPDVEVEEDVQWMDLEANGLRELSRTQTSGIPLHDLKTLESQFPPLDRGNPLATARSQQLKPTSGPSKLLPLVTPPTRSRDGFMPIHERETPQITKNKLMRGEQPPQSSSQSSTSGDQGPSRRRSSFSMRGKRTSAQFDSTGLITRPHTSVSDTSLHKHIDPDLPDTERARQLLIWATARALPDEDLMSSSKKTKSKSKSKSYARGLSALPASGSDIMKEIREALIKQLADKTLEVCAYTDNSDNSLKPQPKENEQNTENRATEKLFLEQIEQRKAEDLAWAEVVQFYNAHQANVMESLERRAKPLNSSVSGKGKQRASSREPDSFLPRESELPERLKGGFELARSLLNQGRERVGKGDARAADMEPKEDDIFSVLSASHRLAQIAASDLDKRFSLLNISLANRTRGATYPSTFTAKSDALSNYIPPSSIQAQQPQQPPPMMRTTHDPHDLLRALARTDTDRPQDQVGDAVRRAVKDVQRVQSAGDEEIIERKLTDLPPPTPRKPPGTPRRR